MLVLTRKQQEKIQIGDDIVITVLRLKGKTVRIGIEAPSATPVLRGELAVRIREESEQQNNHQNATPESPPTPSSDSRDERAEQPGAGEWPIDGSSEPKVLLKRAPRSRVATVLPQMLGEASRGEAGPLRAMLDRRGEVVSAL